VVRIPQHVIAVGLAEEDDPIIQKNSAPSEGRRVPSGQARTARRKSMRRIV
jgi:hypothetical protein